jgi:hypothetical protein
MHALQLVDSENSRSDPKDIFSDSTRPSRELERKFELYGSS